MINRTSLVYALQNWLSESPDQAARKPGSNPGILGVAMGLMAVFVVCILSPCLPPQPTSDTYFFSSQVPGTFSARPFAGVKPVRQFFLAVYGMADIKEGSLYLELSTSILTSCAASQS